MGHRELVRWEHQRITSQTIQRRHAAALRLCIKQPFDVLGVSHCIDEVSMTRRKHGSWPAGAKCCFFLVMLFSNLQILLQRQVMHKDAPEATFQVEDVPYRIFAKNKEVPGLAMSRSIGDLSGHSVGVTHQSWAQLCCRFRDGPVILCGGVNRVASTSRRGLLINKHLQWPTLCAISGCHCWFSRVGEVQAHTGQ